LRRRAGADLPAFDGLGSGDLWANETGGAAKTLGGDQNALDFGRTGPHALKTVFGAGLAGGAFYPQLNGTNK
jgi:hypothetical protein